MSQDKPEQQSLMSRSGKGGQARLGDLLVRAGLIPQEVLGDAMRQAGNNASRVGDILVAMKYLSQHQLNMAEQAMDMMKDGSLELFDAVRALRMVHRSDTTFRDALRRAGASTGTARGGAEHSPTTELGELLADAGILNYEGIAKAQLKSQQTGLPIGRTLVQLGALTEPFLNAALNALVAIKQGRMDREVALKALKVAYKGQLTAGAAAPKLTPATIRLGDLVAAAGIASDFAVCNALELGIEQGRDVGTIMVQTGMITTETLSAAVELWQSCRNNQCSLQDACQELLEVHQCFPVTQATLAALAAAQLAAAAPPQPAAPAPAPPPAGPTATGFGNVIMPQDQTGNQRVIQLGGGPTQTSLGNVIMPDQTGSQRVIQLGPGPSAPSPDQSPPAPTGATRENLMSDLEDALARSKQGLEGMSFTDQPANLRPQGAAPPTPGQSGNFPAQSGLGQPGQPGFGQTGYGQPGFGQPGLGQQIPSTMAGAPRNSNEAVSDALSEMFGGMQVDENKVQSIEDQWRKEEEDRRRLKQELADADKQQQAQTGAALASIRSQEATSAETEMRNEQESIGLRMGNKKRNIMIGAGAGALVIILAICGMMMGGNSNSNSLESARKHLKEDMREVARQEIKLAISKQPNNPEALLILGEIQYKDSEFKEALQTFKDAEANGAKLNDNHIQMMAKSAIKVRNWTEARAITERQLAKKSTPELLVQMGRIDRDSGDTAMALSNFDKAIEGGYPYAYRERGELYFNLKQPRKAMSDFDQALKANNKDTQAHFLRARTHLLTNDPRSALEDFAAATSPDKPDAAVLAYQAVAHNRLDQHETAIDVATKALDVDRNNIVALLARADAYLAKGSYRKAEADYENVLQIEPDNSVAKNKLQKAYVARKRSTDSTEDAPANDQASPAPEETPEPTR